MNLIVLFLISQTIKASFSTEDSFFDFLGEPSLESETVNLGSQGQERGYMKNCNPNSTYSLSWVPKDIDPHGSLTFFINYTNPARFDSGEVTVDIKYSFIHINWKTNVTCQDDIRRNIPLLNCPIEKEKAKFTNYQLFWRKIIRWKNFKGTFKIKLTAENDDGESLLCGTLELTVL